MMGTEARHPILTEVQETYRDWIVGQSAGGGYIAVHRYEGLGHETEHRKVTVTAKHLELLAARLHVQEGLRDEGKRGR